MKILVLSDEHCGHRAGLTPPAWWQMHGKFGKLQRECWEWFRKETRAIKADVVVNNGDFVEGKGDYSGGVECITTDRNTQVEMAAECLKATGCKRSIIIAGTARHTAHEGGEDYEEALAKEVGAEAFSGQEFLDSHGTVFHFKHHIGGSGAPYGQGTALQKEHVWNVLWSERENQQRKADVTIRSHRHAFTYTGDANWLGIVTPALQAAATRFGRRCSGTVDFGFIVFETYKGGYTWQQHLFVPVAQHAKLRHL